MLTAAGAADRLGVKVPTIYAYVSRGALSSRKAPDGRRSLFDPDEVEALARRGRPRRSTRPPALEFSIETAVTAIEDHRLRYRGRDASSLARSATFEQVAELLWTGTLPARTSEWRSVGLDLPQVPLLDHLRIAVPTAAAIDPLRGDLRPEAVAATARSLIATMVGSLPVLADGRAPRLDLGSGPQRGTLSGQLWTRLSDRRPRPGHLPILNAALVLLADHEMASSTLAARVAASTRADPYAVVMAGLGALAGTWHGGASRAMRRLLVAAEDDAGVAVAEALAQHGIGTGFGHPLYLDADPRAEVLLAMLRRAAAGTRRLGVVEQVLGVASRRVPTAPNVDFALAAFGYVADLPEEAGEVVFTIARTSGWLAHAMEEYTEPPLRFRPRGVYVG